jgi:hypothetical protein
MLTGSLSAWDNKPGLIFFGYYRPTLFFNFRI